MSDSQRYSPEGWGSSPAETVTTIIGRANTVLADDNACEGAQHVASAPGVLDVMGGITDYTGGTIVGMSIAPRVFVTAQRRNDGMIVVRDRSEGGNHDSTPGASIAFPLSDNLVDKMPMLSGDAVQGNGHPEVDGKPDSGALLWAAPVIGVVHAMKVTSKIGDDIGGVSIVVDGDMPVMNNPSYRAASTVATVGALTELWSLRTDPMEMSFLAARAENDMFAIPCGVGHAAVATLCEPGHLAQIDTEKPSSAHNIRLPAGVTIVGIDTGAHSRNILAKYRETRTASYMGRRFIEQALRNRGFADQLPVPPLATICHKIFKSAYSERIPDKLIGSVFLDEFKSIEDTLTTVDPAVVYKIHSRTAHHVYDSDRALQFARLMTEAGRTNNHDTIIDAGRLMCKSHWSYTQRCGFVCVEAELLVKSILDRREGTGIHGVRFSGYGCGGLVVVMMDDTPETHSLLAHILGEYENATSNKTRIFRGTGPGQQAFGVHKS